MMILVLDFFWLRPLPNDLDCLGQAYSSQVYRINHVNHEKPRQLAT